MLHLTLRQLQVFESAARHLSLSRAAEELHLTQPGVSMQLKKLAEAVGHPLLEHAGKRIKLTSQGEELVKTAREVLGAIKHYELSLVAKRGLSGGNLRIVAITTATYFVPSLLGEFSKRHPGVKVSLRVTNRGCEADHRLARVFDHAVLYVQVQRGHEDLAGLQSEGIIEIIAARLIL